MHRAYNFYSLLRSLDLWEPGTEITVVDNQMTVDIAAVLLP